jgi:hypothetical protein
MASPKADRLVDHALKFFLPSQPHPVSLSRTLSRQIGRRIWLNETPLRELDAPKHCAFFGLNEHW